VLREVGDAARTIRERDGETVTFERLSTSNLDHGDTLMVSVRRNASSDLATIA
jgi:hypothetical protein